VIAIEIDRALAARLRERWASDEQVRIIEADVLDVDLGALAGGDFVLVGNVPYYITTPILFRALRRPRPRQAVFLVQREVADRIVAPAGAGAYGALSVNVQALARAELLFRVPPGAFQPAPSVDSAVIRLTPLADPVVTPDEEEPFRTFVQAAFGMRRKQMRRVLREIWEVSAERADEMLRAAGISPEARIETVAAPVLARLLRERGAGGWERRYT
jgi:16S rRNA (adenine1518-N6/adenine1519-N6)-dimethyltransferase